MTTTAQQNIKGIGSRRLRLEETAVKLRKALDHWSTWEMEYQMLKEELQAAGSPSPAQMVEIGREMQGKLVNEKEVNELLGKDAQKRSANQVIDMISRRLDYVQQNRESIEKQFDKAEKQLEGFEMLTDQGLEAEEGLPMMDIEERLDEDDNVISSNVSQPGKVAPELVEALRKAGINKSEQKNVKDVEDSDDETSAPSAPSPSTSASVATASPVPKEPPTVKVSDAPSAAVTDSPPKSEPKASATPKKSVSFANDVQVEIFEKPKTLQDDLNNWNLKPGAKVYELDEDTDEVLSKAVVPTDTPEEAALRREMLQYGLNEVNDVVAKLELDDDDDEMDDDYDYDEEYDSEVSEEEDKYGRSTRRVLSDDYIKEMQELEKKLNARMIKNIGPNSDLMDKADDARTLRIRKDDEFEQSMSTAASGLTNDDASKKGVRFTDNLDVSEALQSPIAPSVPIKLPPTVSDTIVERAPSVPQPPSAPLKPAKTSRFKSARASANGPPPILSSPAVPEPPPVPTGPTGRVLATSVAEHSPHPSEPHAPDEFDPVIHNRQVTAEYHKLRNKMISQQGGFKPTEEDEDDPLMEERNGKTKKVSRFKAAKLKAEGL
ncbi:hypothetical protein BU23DRAFT_561646 [Bimuria novae-zelandiae CBS 107.79]|uniref:DUF3835 domain-containing protein n=1 Tax=Bimuria novae-zelandiae CBS 107.79 TaxID=1447943 RepID=A0A6A5UHS1_9PLEO|nr:hypothetical protein BU23DRAFT_561646 [Bimuria novae-zelandiae CBS 107.79]